MPGPTSLSGSRCSHLAGIKAKQIRAPEPPRATRSRWRALLEDLDEGTRTASGRSTAGRPDPAVELARLQVEAAYSKPTYTYLPTDAQDPDTDAVMRLQLKLEGLSRELLSVTEAEYNSGLAANIRPPSPRQMQLGSMNNVVTSPQAQQQHSMQPPQQYREQYVEEEEIVEEEEVYPAYSAPLPRMPDTGKGSRAEGTGHEILLQGFNWESWKHGWFNKIADQSQELADMGFTAVWLPPFTDSVSEQGYMPRDLYNLNSRYGSEEQLIRCVKTLQSHGIKVLGDAVLNHRCAQHQGQGGVWNQFGGRMSWDERAIVGDHSEYRGAGNLSSGELFGAAPNIDHSQEFVKRDLCEWMVWLRTHVGFDGWRLDFVKGFHGSHVKDYVEASSPDFTVGEYWDSLCYQMDGTPAHDQDKHRQRIINWINAAGGLATAFDITTKGILHAVFERCEYWRLADKAAKPPGLMGWWPSRAVTFLENHDTGSTQGHWRFPAHALEQGYVYLLTHPGTPTVFYDHLFDNKPLRHLITRLIELRNRTNINCRSEVEILCAERDVYAAEIDERVVMQIGPGDFTPDPAYEIVDCGHCWTIWERKN